MNTTAMNTTATDPTRAPRSEKPYRPGFRAWRTMFVAESKMVVRDTAGLIVPLGLPLLILVLQGLMIPEAGVNLPSGHSIMGVYALPIVFTMVVATVGMINVPSFLATYRKNGILKQLSVTPASPMMVLISQLLVGVAKIIVGMIAAYVVAQMMYGVGTPDHLLTFLAVLGATTFAMFSVGMIVSSISPTPNSAIAIGLVAFFAIGALGGMFGPVELPGILDTIGSWLPFGAAVDGLQAAWLGESVEARTWLGLGATTGLGVLVSAALFRWE